MFQSAALYYATRGLTVPMDLFMSTLVIGEGFPKVQGANCVGRQFPLA
jgi:hypothetical protein